MVKQHCTVCRTPAPRGLTNKGWVIVQLRCGSKWTYFRCCLPCCWHWGYRAFYRLVTDLFDAGLSDKPSDWAMENYVY